MFWEKRAASGPRSSGHAAKKMCQRGATCDDDDGETRERLKVLFPPSGPNFWVLDCGRNCMETKRRE